MSNICLYLDEDSSAEALLQALRSAGVDVKTAVEEGTSGLSDVDQLRLATVQGRVVYTFNIRDFHRLHALFLTKNESHAGIIVAQQQRFTIGEQLRGILRIVSERTAEDMQNDLVYLGGWVSAGWRITQSSGCIARAMLVLHDAERRRVCPPQ